MTACPLAVFGFSMSWPPILGRDVKPAATGFSRKPPPAPADVRAAVAAAALTCRNSELDVAA
jgi:hypothetical protein